MLASSGSFVDFVFMVIVITALISLVVHLVLREPPQRKRQYGHQVPQNAEGGRANLPGGIVAAQQYFDQLVGYRFVEELGRGAFGVVYKALHDSGKTFAVKVIANDDHGCNEVAIHEQVRAVFPYGPVHLVRYVDYKCLGSNLYLILEYFEYNGDGICPGKRTPYGLMNIAQDTAKGAAELAKAGIVHDDLKPSNICCTSSGRLVWTDFGGARFRHQTTIRGYTEGFAAPEIYDGKSTETSPIYSWARCIEYFLYGDVGVVGNLHSMSEIVWWVGPEFSNILTACLDESPTRRPTALELEHRVRTCVRKACPCGRCGSIYFSDSYCPFCTITAPS